MQYLYNFKTEMKHIELVVLVGFLTKVTFGLDYITEKPNYLTPCSIRDPNFVQCSTNTMQQLFNQWRTGIPGLQTLQKSDPYHINKVRLSQNTGQASVKVELKNIDILGFRNFVVKENRVNEKDYSFATDIFTPNVRMDGEYKLDGRLLLLTLKGQGKMFIDMDNVSMHVDSRVQLYEKAGLTFGNVTDVDIILKIGGLKTRFDNLFNGNVELEDSINILFNENWTDFLEALRPAITQTISSILKDNLSKIFHFIPAKYFISDIPTSQQLYG